MEDYVQEGPLKALLSAVIRLASYGVGCKVLPAPWLVEEALQLLLSLVLAPSLLYKATLDFSPILFLDVRWDHPQTPTTHHCIGRPLIV